MPTPKHTKHSSALAVYGPILARTQALASRQLQPTASVDISQELARREKISNDSAEQDITLRRRTLSVLFGFLAAETLCIFGFAFFQAIHWPFNFNLDEWSFRLLVTATIAQITGMLFVAVRYLFPGKGGGSD